MTSHPTQGGALPPEPGRAAPAATSLPPGRVANAVAGRNLGRGSWLLASAGQRMGAAVLVSAALWAMTAWAMGWW